MLIFYLSRHYDKTSYKENFMLHKVLYLCKIFRNDNMLLLFLIFYQKIIDFTLSQSLWQAKNKREEIL